MKEPLPGFRVWTAKHPDIGSTVGAFLVDVGEGQVVIDPMPADPEVEAACFHRPPQAILLTSDLHVRDTENWKARFGCPVYAHPAAAVRLDPGVVDREVGDGEVMHGLTCIALPGVHPGEVAWWSALEGGTLIVGDALLSHREPKVRFHDSGEGRPENLEQGKRSVMRLLDLPLANVLFGHGLPVIGDATTRLRRLLEQEGLLPSS